MALAVGAQVMGKAGLLGNAGRGGKDGSKPFIRRGRWGTVMSIEGRIGTGTSRERSMPECNTPSRTALPSTSSPKLRSKITNTLY